MRPKRTGTMRRRKSSFWGKKRPKPDKKLARVPGVNGAIAVALDTTDYGQFYDKINAREKCDDLVLLENVSTEGIVEVRRSPSFVLRAAEVCGWCTSFDRRAHVISVAGSKGSIHSQTCVWAIREYFGTYGLWRSQLILLTAVLSFF